MLTNDSMTDEEKKQLEEERARVEEAAKLRDEDYQLAYAVDILKGLAVADYSADKSAAATPSDAGATDNSDGAKN